MNKKRALAALAASLLAGAVCWHLLSVYQFSANPPFIP